MQEEEDQKRRIQQCGFPVQYWFSSLFCFNASPLHLQERPGSVLQGLISDGTRT